MQRNLNRARTAALIVGGILVFSLGGCPNPFNPDGNNPNNDTGADNLVGFASPEDLLNYFKARVREVRGGGSAVRTFFAGELDNAGAPPAVPQATTGAADDAGGDGGGASAPFSTTNVQEVGVDEADIVKSDGVNLFVARGNRLTISRISPRDAMAGLSEIELDSSVNEMYLLDGRILIVGKSYGTPAPYFGMADIALIWPPYYYDAKTTLVDVDITDPTAPKIVSSATLDGSLVNSRLVKDRLLLVMSVAPEISGMSDAAIDRLTLNDLIPKIATTGGNAELVPWNRWYRPDPANGFYTTAVVTIDANDVTSVVGSSAVMASAGTIYASTDALYLSDTDYTMGGQPRETTLLHKFAYDDNGVARYAASGRVPGRLLNQFSLDEHEGNLRVATHVQPTVPFWAPEPWPLVIRRDAQGGNAVIAAAPPASLPPQPSNSVYVVGETDGRLVIRGAIENIAPGETIYSARFMGDIGFLVTFVQVDPLFTMNLADPEHPAIVGELKVEGVSDYLHPFGENRLIGIGRSTITAPWGGTRLSGLQVSLFDVSDLANPTLIQHLNLGGVWSYSSAAQEYKSIAFLPELGLLAFPAVLTDATDPNDYDYTYSNALAIVRVTDSSLENVGKLDYYAPAENTYYYGIGGTRGMFIGSTAYAIDWWGVRAADVSSLDSTSELAFPPDFDPYGYNYIGYGGGPTVDVGVATDASVPPSAGAGVSTPGRPRP